MVITIKLHFRTGRNHRDLFTPHENQLLCALDVGSWKTKLTGLWPNELKLDDGGQRPATTIYTIL